MKILISLSYYSPHISGLTLSLQRLSEALVTRDYKVTVLTTQHEKHLPLEENIKDVSVIRVPYLFRISKGFFMPQFAFKAFQAIRRTESILIALPQPEGFFVALLAKMMGKKVICFYVCEVTMNNGIVGKVIEVLLRLVNRMTLSFADEITTLTDDFAKHNDMLKRSGKNVKGIYPIVLPPKIDTSERDALNQKLPNKHYIIGYLGRIAAEKGIDNLLETIPVLQKELGDTFVITLAGPKKTIGEDVYKRKIEALLKKYPEYIVHLGELSDEQLGAFYSLLDVFVLPSINNTEAFGMVQVEAMYCGTPVVATDLPGVRVPVKITGMGELVPCANVSSLAQAIGKVLQNKKNYVKDISKIKEIFSTEKIVEAYQTLFTS